MALRNRLVWTLLFADVLLLTASYPILDGGRPLTEKLQRNSRVRRLLRRATQDSFATLLLAGSSRSLKSTFFSKLGNDLALTKVQRRPLHNIHNISAKASPLPRRDHKNFTLDNCVENDHCEGVRDCLWVSDRDFGICNEKLSKENICFCFPFTADLPICESDKNCAPEEFCALLTEIKEPLCVSRTYLKFPEDFRPVDPPPPEDEETKPESVTNDEPAAPKQTDGGSCVDARALQHLPQQELVLDRHTLAKVLCDDNGSCATPGHVVLFEQKPMMMRTYCANVGCQESVMAVNSPRYQRLLRIDSRTKGLQYTSFAARYETVVEEAILGLAITVGA